MFIKKNLLFWLSIILLISVRWTTTRPKYVDGSRIRISALVSSEPLKYTNSQNLKLLGLKITLPRYPEINYGDIVKVEGEVKAGILEKAKIVEIKDSHNFLFDFRNKLTAFYQSALPEPHSALLAGVVIGSKSSLPTDFWNSLKNSGTAHVVVASGMNVTLTAGFLLGILLLFLNRKKALLIAIAGIWVYVTLSGFEAPLIRAAIMVSAAFIAQLAGRLSDARRVFFLTAAIMLVINPGWLTDLGFILSFAATASMLFFQKTFSEIFKRIPAIFREDFVTTTSAQVGVAPLLYLAFGQFNLLSPIINTLILWTVAPMMVIGAVGGIIGTVFPFLGRIILLFAYPLTWWFVNIIQVFG